MMNINTAILLLLFPVYAAAQSPGIMGFSPERAGEQRSWENIMAAEPDATSPSRISCPPSGLASAPAARR